jgi:5-methyltetrahydrofolate--homocysteine methyltransferase
MDFERRESLKHVLAEQSKKMLEAAPKVVDAPADAAPRRSSVRRDVEIPKPPDLKTHVIRNYDLGEIFEYINPKSSLLEASRLSEYVEALEAGDPRRANSSRSRRGSRAEILARTDISANAVYRFFPAQSDGDRTVRMAIRPTAKRCSSRSPSAARATRRIYASPTTSPPRDSGRTDYLCMFVTTIGTGVRALAEEWKNKGDYLRSHILQVLALEGAEAFAELLHEKIRQMWGIGDPPGLTLKDLVQAHYHGKRFSFGYPACPRLEDQEQLFRLLEVEKNAIGVQPDRGLHDGS